MTRPAGAMIHAFKTSLAASSASLLTSLTSPSSRSSLVWRRRALEPDAGFAAPLLVGPALGSDPLMPGVEARSAGRLSRKLTSFRR